MPVGGYLHGAAPSADVAAMLEHFKGPFLPEDEGPSWLLAGREAVAAAVRSTLLIAESLFEGNNDPSSSPRSSAHSAPTQPRKTWRAR